MKFKIKSLPLFQLLLLAMLSFAIILLYWGLLLHLIHTLAHDDDFSYGLLLPFVSCYIIYLKWPDLRRQPWQPSWWGLVLMTLGFIIYLAGNLVADAYSPVISFFIVISGIILLLGGRKIVLQVAFPILILVLMVPLPMFVTQHLTLPLQLISSRLAAGFLQALGVPLLLHGNVIDLGARQLQVVAACSGLRYVLALLALGIIYCYFYQRRPWKAAILILSIVPSAILTNALRVAGMGIFPGLQEGFWHAFSGWLIFVFCFGFLAILNWILNYLQPETSMIDTKGTPEDGEPFSGGNTSYSPYLIAGLILTIIAIPLIQRTALVAPMPLRQSFINFPMQLGHWQGHHTYIDPGMVKVTQADAYINADFTNPEHASVNLWIAYYEDQKSGGSVHSPFSCLTGGGWVVLESSTFDVAPSRPVKYLLMDQAGNRMVVYYWYIQRGRWLTNEYFNKFFIGFDRLAKRRADGALIRLITPATPDVESARQRLDSFAKLLMPILPQFIQ